MEPVNNVEEKLGRFVKNIISDPKKLYVIGLILIVLFPPINRITSASTRFQGWEFITGLGGRYHINIPYLIIEFILITVVYYLFRKKK